MNKINQLKDRLFAQVKKEVSELRDFIVKNKLGLYFLLGIVLLAGILYYSQHLLFLEPRTKQILGISLQLISGIILVLDQIFLRAIKTETPQNIREWSNKLIEKGNPRVSLILLLFLAPIALITFLVLQALNEEEILSWSTIGGAFMFIIIGFNSYLYSLIGTQKLYERLGKKWKKFKENTQNTLYNNIFLFSASLLLTVVFLVLIPNFGKIASGTIPQQTALAIWFFAKQFAYLLIFFIFVFGVLPIYILSIFYFLILGIVMLFLFCKKHIPRLLFWLFIFLLWTIGGVLQLINACLS